MSKKIKTLYELFPNNTKEQIDAVINGLSKEERKLLLERYGNDLENPKEPIDWTKKKNDHYYGNIYGKIKRILLKMNDKKSQEDKNIKSQQESSDEEIIISSIFSVPLKGYSKKEITLMTKELTDEEFLFLTDPQNEQFKNFNSSQKHHYIQNLIYRMLIILRKNKTSKVVCDEPIKKEIQFENSGVKQPEITQFEEEKKIVINENKVGSESQKDDNNKQEIQEKDYHQQMIQNYLSNPTFLNELRSLSCEKITIVSLKYGLASKHCFSVEEISVILDLSVEYIADVLRSFLNNYKQKVNDAIDSAINSSIYEEGHCRQAYIKK